MPAIGVLGMHTAHLYARGDMHTMKKRPGLDNTRATRPARRARMAVAMAGIIAGAGGIVAGPADATPAHKAHSDTHRRGHTQFNRPKLTHGTLIVEGTPANDKFALRLQAGRPDILQVDVGDDGSADFSIKRKHVAKIVVRARAGDDLVRIDEGNGTFTDTIPTTLDGGAGDDRIAGGTGVEQLLGGDGNDTIDGNGGNDVARMGAGDDTFVWDPGDGSDTVEGESGADTLRFNGAAGAEHIDLSANGNRLRFFRDVATITMDTNDVETVDFNALGGADTVTVNDLTGTDVTSVNTDLAGTPGGTTGDNQPDSVIVNGTNGNDAIDVQRRRLRCRRVRPAREGHDSAPGADRCAQRERPRRERCDLGGRSRRSGDRPHPRWGCG